METQIQAFETTCEDGVVLKGKLIIPDEPKAVVQLNAGTATKKEFYLPFLTYLAEHGYLGCLWDYRGTGESAPESLKDCSYSFSEYGTKDMPAIRDYLKTQFPTLSLMLVGHSAGGQQVGLMDSCEDYLGMIGVAVSTGYAPGFFLGYRLQTEFFFRLYTPISVLLTGYLAAKRFGIMEDLPKHVIYEWRDWCHEKEYLFHPKFRGKTIPYGHYDEMPFPMHVYRFTDDKLSTEANVTSLWSHIHSQKEIIHHVIAPEEIGEKAIGHFGFFRKRMKDKIWPGVLEQLDEFLSQRMLTA